MIDKRIDALILGCNTKATETILGLTIKKVQYDIEDNIARYCRPQGQYEVVDSTLEKGILYYIIKKVNSNDTTKIEAKCFTIVEAENIN